MASKILSGDQVIVLRGKDKGSRGRVRQNLPREEKVVVEGINIVRKHLRQGRARQAGIVEVEAPMHVSKVMLICPTCDEATRVGFREDEYSNKERFCKKCNATIARNER